MFTLGYLVVVLAASVVVGGLCGLAGLPHWLTFTIGVVTGILVAFLFILWVGDWWPRDQWDSKNGWWCD